MSEIYVLSLGIFLAALLAITVKRYKQPLIVSYILAGALLSALGVVNIKLFGAIRFLPDIGLAFLLFLVGMELDIKFFRTLGKNILVAAGSQIVIGAMVILVILQHFSLPHFFWIAPALTFSSTILVVKLLLENQELSSLHGRLTVGILLLEDFAAMLILMFVSILGQQNGFSILSVFLVLVKGGLLFWLSLFTGRKVLPRLTRFVAETGELLFLVAICWCLLFVSLANFLGFSLGIGAFLAGVSLAQSAYRVSISGKIKPLRDFFIMIFFIDLGTNLSLSSAFTFPGLIISLLVYVLLIKPLIFFSIFIFFRFRGKTAFQTGIGLSSVSEFSLIIIFLLAKQGIIDQKTVSPILFTTVVSFIISSFFISHARFLYLRFHRLIKKAEREKVVSLDFLPTDKVTLSDHALLIGCRNSGEIILHYLRKVFGDNLLVVDYDPEIIERLKAQYIPCIYGDVEDPEIQDKLNFKQAKLVISTIENLGGNLALLDGLEKATSSATVIMTANDAKEAIQLYERGAHHVSLPLNLEGHNITRLVSDYKDSLHELSAMREKKLEELKRSSSS